MLEIERTQGLDIDLGNFGRGHGVPPLGWFHTRKTPQTLDRRGPAGILRMKKNGLAWPRDIYCLDFNSKIGGKNALLCPPRPPHGGRCPLLPPLSHEANGSCALRMQKMSALISVKH